MSETITPESTGTFKVRTAGGTELVLELTKEGPFLTRKPGMFRPDGGSDPVRLQGDFTRLPLAVAPTVAVGSPGRFVVVVDDVAEHRGTAPIVSIEAG